MDFFSVQNILVHIPIGAGGYDLSWIEAVGTIAGLLCIGLASLVCGEFVKRNWHGESPCAEGQSATGVLSPTLILSVRVQVLILNSPGGTRHHVHDDTDTRL